MKQLLAVILWMGISVSSGAGELEDNQKACNDGMAIGCQNLGDIYYKGKSIKQDYLEAAKYYAKACNGGYASGCSTLASMSEKGQGIVKNTGYIAMLYAKACEGNDFKGCYGSLMVYKRGLEGVSQKNYLSAKEFFSKAAKDGDPRALEIYNKLIAGKLYPLKKGSKYGFINTKGEWVIKPKFDDVEESVFKDNNLLRVKLNGQWGYINAQGEWINEPKFDEEVSDIQKAKLNDEWDVAYIRGEWMIIEPLLYSEKENDLTRVDFNGKWGVKDTKDEWILEPKFDSIKENDYGGGLTFDGELFLVTYNGKKAIVNTKGKWVIRQYDDILYGQENIIVDINGWIKVKYKGKWGAIDTNGKWIFKPQFDDVESFTVYDQLTVKHKGKWGFINRKGKWVIKPKYDGVYHFSENDVTGFGRIFRNDKEGYVSDVDGLLLEPIIDRSSYGPSYEEILALQKTGLFIVDSDDDKRGVVDKKGNWVLKQKFDTVEILDDLIYVTFGDWEGYTSLDGKYLTFTKGDLHLEELKKASNIGNAKDIRRHLFVCYREKSKNDTGKIVYQECIRSDVKCSNIKRFHFGEYLNDLKAHEAFNRCTGGNPKLAGSPVK